MKKILNDNRGMSLFIVLAMMVILMSIAGATSLYTSITARATGNVRGGTNAFHIADAGINHAVRELSNGDGVNDFATIFLASNGTQIVSNNSFNGGSYVVTRQGSATPPNRLKIRSVSTGLNGSTAKIEAWIQTTGTVYGCGICTTKAIALGGGATTDSYDSSKGVYNALLPDGTYNKALNGHVGGNTDITLTGNAMVQGNATAKGTVSIGNGSIVTGTVTNGAPPMNIPPLTACSPYSNGTGITGGSYNAATGTLTVGNNASVTLTPGTYCFSTISLGNGAQLNITGKTTINFTNDTDLSNGDILNATGSPAMLTIQSSSNDSFKFTAGSLAHLTVNCPKCSVTVSGSADVYGAIIAETFNMTGGAKFHYDTGIKIYGWVQTF